MGFSRDLSNQLVTTPLHPPAAVTASANGTGLDLAGYAGNILFQVNVGAATAGTNPTMNVTIEDSADNSTFAAVGATKTWHKDGVATAGPIAASQVTTVALNQELQADVRQLRRYVRHVVTIGGTASPSFPVNIVAIGQKRVQ